MNRKEKLEAILKEIQKNGDKDEAIFLCYTKSDETFDGVCGAWGRTETIARMLVAMLRSNAELKMIYDYYNAKAEILDKMPDKDPEKVSKDKN